MLLLLLGIMLMTAQLMAQNRTITGRVLDEKGSPVSGASVVVKGTRMGATTNANGEFSITLPNNARALVVSGIGFAEQQINLGSENTIAVNLKQDSRNMEEVVVTGYTRERKSQFSGAASSVSSKAVELVPVGAFDQALQGRAPGMLVNSASGQPGASASITIRGVQSITAAGAQPLFVLDGVPLPSGAFQTLNPNDFESITVLKDAAAAAQYGSRAGTGVIVITTKRGRAGATSIQYRAQVGITKRPEWNNFDMMDAREALLYEERIKIGGTPGWTYSKLNPTYATLPATSPGSDPYSASQARYDFIRDSIGQIHTDILDLFFRNGISQLHEVNMSGGAEKTRFYLSASYFNQEGTDLRAQLKRYTTRFNIDHTSNKVSVQFNTSAGYSTMDQSEGEWYGNSTRNTFQMSWRSKAYENPYKSDGSLNIGASTALNPKVVADAMEGIQNSTLKQNQIKVNSGIAVSYKLLPSVTLKNVFGVDINEDRYERWINPNSYIGSVQTFQKGLDVEAYRTLAQLVNTSSAIYSQRFNNIHEVEVGAYFEAIRAWQKAIGFTLYNLDPRLPSTGQGAGPIPISAGQTSYTQTAASAKSGYGIRSYFGTLRYSYNNRYTINGTVRRDGTSRILKPENREVTTWSVGTIWNAIQEDFIKNLKWLSDFRMRASYGSVPNIGSIPTGSYAGLLQSQSITSVTNFMSPQVPSFVATSYAGSTLSGLAPNTPGNPDLKIETIRKLNIGMDIAVLKNRIRLGVDVYKNKTIDLFVTQPLPRESGFTSANINAGVMTNKGIEFLLGLDVVKSRNFDVSLSANHAINKNNIEDLGVVDQYETGTFIIKKGLPYGTHYTYHYMGADPATGRPVYETEAGGITTDLGKAGRFYKFGTYLPKHVGGFNADFRYRAFTVSAFFSYQFDVVRSNNIESWVTRGTSGYAAAVNQSKRLLTQQWQKPGDVVYYQNTIYDRDFTSADLQDSKFFRFRNLNIAYTVPELSIRKTHLIRSARIYLQFQNLFIWSPWRGPDPEDNNNISLNEYPNPRMVVTGIDINF
jgi:TonB-linked SusC/RagA family outer membrane protein